MNDRIAFKFLKWGNTSISNLLLKNYAKLGMNADEFVFFLEMKLALEQDQRSLNFQKIAQIMNKQEAEIYQLLHGLIEKGLVNMNSAVDDQGRNFDEYNFDPMYQKLIKFLSDQEEKVESQQNQVTRQTVFDRIEQEFGHPLSSFDMEMIDSWLKEDNYSPEIIILALKEAVLSGVYNLKYMDKILLAWEKKGIKTAADVQQQRARQRRNEKGQKQQGNANKPKIPLTKWSNKNNSK